MRRAPVVAALATAAVLHVVWLVLIANGGGDLAAQDAWAAFARAHPGSAYDLAWYGGMHPGSYSVLSPYVMALIGVRTTMVLAGVVASGLLALILARTEAVRRPMLPALYGAFAIAGNTFSGRVTFGLGLAFGLAAVAVVFAPGATRPGRPVARGLAAGLLAALATASSPVAGLFLGVVAAALWLSGRRGTAIAVGIPPVAVILIASALFPFSGEQPMKPVTAILPILVGLCCAMLPPRSWRVVRRGAAFYALGVVAVLLIPSQIGSNVARLALIFGGVVLVAVAAEHLAVTRRVTYAAVVAVLISTVWQAGIATADVVNTRSASTWSHEVQPLVRQLLDRHAELARVEVVPSRSHREASALAPYVNLARGWNRQADAGRNPLFYGDVPLDSTAYRAWLDRWAVGFVFLPTTEPDPAAVDEANLIRGGLSYLKLVWSGSFGRLYAVQDPTPLISGNAKVVQFGAGEIVVDVPKPGDYRLRVLSSPWLALLDEDGSVISAPSAPTEGSFPVNVDGCLSTSDDWAVLRAPAAGRYRISTPYAVPRGTACPSVTADQR
ncbi:MFS transporter [Nocardioides marmorisolisilvae]|uniref:MFS transporter n=1 Tax=Nocardioides marmorisolisilvae TaxID=1542737 RepID=A0A3N0E006_9ACTN|nr:MFS transporter [Nocardioides marmorisolisilvae]RNL81140.1 MFS transporter [Nocardioides marmorisolisilvae]